MFIRALRGHSGKNLDISTFSRKRIEKGHEPFLYRVGFPRNEDSTISGGPVPGGFGKNRDRKAVYFSLVSPDPKHKPYFNLKNHHDLLFVIDLEAAQNKQRTGVSYVATQFRPSSSPRSPTSKLDQKGSRKHNQKKEKHHQRRKADAIGRRGRKPQDTNQTTKRHSTRDR